MTNPYGPWATAIDIGGRARLSSFWRQRLTMLVPASQTSSVLSRRSLLGLVAAGVLVCALPTFLPAPAVAEQEKASPEKGENQGKDAGARDSAATEFKAAASGKQITNSIGMKLTLIPSGEFKMGSGESAEATAAFFNKTYGEDRLTADSFKDEHPQHRVRITKPFYLGTYHVTRGQFRQFVADTGYKTDAEKGEKPGAIRLEP